MENIYSITFSRLVDYFLKMGEKKYRAIQLFDWLYVKRVTSFDSITNIKKEIISQLKKDFYFDKIEIVNQEEDIDVKKYLLKVMGKQLKPF